MAVIRVNLSLAVLALAGALTACSGQQDTSDAPTVRMTTAREALAAPSMPPVAPSAAPAPSASAGAAMLAPEGMGVLRIGMPLPQNSGWNEDQTQISDQCRTISSNGQRHVYAIGDGKVIERITVSAGSGIKTERGIGIGEDEAQVRRAYPGIKAEPHKYVDPPAKYLTWIPAPGQPGLRFEIGADGKVTLIHAGAMPWLAYVEGCA